MSDGFYGTGETFVFTFCPQFEVWNAVAYLFRNGVAKKMCALVCGHLGSNVRFALRDEIIF